MKPKTLTEFEQQNAGGRIRSLEQQLAVEQRKVETLIRSRDKPIVIYTKSKSFRFALHGDTHVGSLYHHGGAWTAFIEYCLRQKVTTILHTGDILDGNRVYKGQEYELRDVGMEAQLDRLKQTAPPTPIQFITGNHDQSYKAQAGVPIGKVIEQTMPGWKFHGDDQAHIQFQTPDSGRFDVMLLHPGGGTAYAISYHPQKITEALAGGTKPDLLAIGHYHKAEWMPSYRNVCVVQTGTFQKQTPFMARRASPAHVGGWIVDVCVGDGTNIIRGEFVAFYK